jgi:hypothetical protein
LARKRKPPVIQSSLYDHAIDDDRQWFKNNPGRQHRIMPPLPGELVISPAPPRPDHELIVVVREVRPGARLRVMAEHRGAAPINSEAMARDLYEQARSAETVAAEAWLAQAAEARE